MSSDLIKGKSEYDSLQEHIASLREQIAVLTAERDELLYRECPRIQAEYDAKIGYRVLELYRAKARLLQLKRAVEILQAARNRQEEKDPDQAEREAREAFREREKELEEEAKKIRENKERQKQEEKKDEEWRKKHDSAFAAETGRDITVGTVSSDKNTDAQNDSSGIKKENTGKEAAGSEENSTHKDGQPPKVHIP